VSVDRQPLRFRTEAFGDISEEPVSEEKAAQLQAILSDMAGGAVMAALSAGIFQVSSRHLTFGEPSRACRIRN
jgi:hypothetical protein